MEKKFRVIKLYLILLFFIIVSSCASSKKSQELKIVEIHQESDLYLIVETMPVFQNDPSEQKLNEYLQSKTEMELSSKTKKNKTYNIQFVIDTDGSISFYQILDGPENPKIRGDIGRMFNEMPNWEPGSQDGKNVKVSKRIVLTFN